jgi:hypothetical protein
MEKPPTRITEMSQNGFAIRASRDGTLNAAPGSSMLLDSLPLLVPICAGRGIPCSTIL